MTVCGICGATGPVNLCQHTKAELDAATKVVWEVSAPDARMTGHRNPDGTVELVIEGQLPRDGAAGERIVTRVTLTQAQLATLYAGLSHPEGS